MLVQQARARSRRRRCGGAPAVVSRRLVTLRSFGPGGTTRSPPAAMQHTFETGAVTLAWSPTQPLVACGTLDGTGFDETGVRARAKKSGGKG